MTRFSLACAAVCLAVGVHSANASTISIGSGLLTVANGQLVSGPGGWTAASLSYDVSFDDASLSYFYDYTFTGIDPVKNISHVLTQVSDNFTSDDLLGGTTAFGSNDGLGVYGPQGNSNPGIPGSITGIKLHPESTASFSWTIETGRAPMWGNFYAKDGVAKVNGVNQPVYVFNVGFTSAMSQTPPICYSELFFDSPSCSGFLLVPDSVELPPIITTTVERDEVPEPVSLLLFGTGLIAVVFVTRRRTRRLDASQPQ